MEDRKGEFDQIKFKLPPSNSTSGRGDHPSLSLRPHIPNLKSQNYIKTIFSNNPLTTQRDTLSH